MSDNTNNLEEWFIKNMPEGTVIGDPKWWARKIVNVIACTAPEVEQELVQEHIKMLEKRNLVFTEYVSGVEDFYTGIDPNDDVMVRRFKGIVELQRETESQLAEAKKDAERLETLMAMSGEMYAESAKHHFIGRLKEFIDANAKAIDEFLKGEK